MQALKSSPHRDSIKSLAVFGSYISGLPTDASDIDVLIEFDPDATIGLFEFSDIQFYFEDLLGKYVDLLTPQSLSKYFREEVLAQAESVYEK